MNELQVAREIHRRAIVVDLHADTPQRFLDEHIDWSTRLPDGHLDIPRMKAGGLAAEFFALWVQPKFKGHDLARALTLADALHTAITAHPEEIALARTAADIRRLHKEGRIAALVAIEGGHAIEDDLGVLTAFYNLGVRYMTLTWAFHNNWADASTEPPRHNGLTDFGRSVVRRMNDLGMIVDISHVSDKTFYDVLEISRAPIVATHSCCRALCDVPRNMSDQMIRDLASRGGVIHINFHEGFLSQKYVDARRPFKEEMDGEEHAMEERYKDDPATAAKELRKLLPKHEARLPRPTVADVADHIDHVKKLVGVSHIGIGSDFDGAFMPVGLEGADELPNLTAELLRRGYAEAELLQILGENTLRVMQQVENAARPIGRQ